MFLFVFRTLLSVFLVASHPQCLDYLPPFSPSSSRPTCKLYSNFTCCSASDDSEIARLASNPNISAAISSSQDPELCTEFWKNVSCLRCSPYAAHLFEAEGFHSATRSFPGLCAQYCKQLYEACPQLADVIGGSEGPFNDDTAFCEASKLSDESYCYPDVEGLDEQSGRSLGSFGCLCVQEIGIGLRNPIVLTHAGDGSHRLFIAEQVGVVHVMLPNGTILREPYLDIQTKVVTSSRRGDERGFLGMAFHPNYTTNGYCFVYYCTLSKTGANHKIRVSRYNVSKTNANQLDPKSEKVIIEVDQPAANHNGGQILFGIDGYLYVFLGDGGKGGDPFGTIGNGLDRQTLLGSVMRLNVNSNPDVPYTIPDDNPFLDNPLYKKEIYAYGMRNPWRCSVDPGDRETGEGRGRIFCGDVGQNKFEEIDIVVKGGNFAWRGKEGYACYDSNLCNIDDEVLPIHVYDHSLGKSVTGGYVYRGCTFPNLNGKYIFGDYTSGRLFALTEDRNSGMWSSEELCLGDSTVCHSGLTGNLEKNILSFGEDEAGELYVLVTDFASPTHTGGKVYRIIDPARRGDPGVCFGEDILNQPPGTNPNDDNSFINQPDDTASEDSSSATQAVMTQYLMLLSAISALLPSY